MLSSLLEEVGGGCGERLQPHLARLTRATPGFLASDLALLITRIATQQHEGTGITYLYLPTYRYLLNASTSPYNIHTMN